MDWQWLLFSFEGRINRAKWWLGNIILMVIEWIVFVLIQYATIGTLIMEPSPDGALPPGFTSYVVLTVIALLVFLWPSLALATKRWHDRDKSGWWTLIVLIPVAGGIWFLIECGILRGTMGPNRFGPDPLGRP